MADVSVKDLVMEWLLGSASAGDIAGQIGRVCGMLRASLFAPMVRVSLCVSLVMSTIVFVEWIYVGAVAVYVKLFRRTPEKRYRWEPIEGDSEAGNAAFPMVLVQIPLFNEKEVYKLSIGAACQLSWPAGRLLIQVIDSSTDVLIKGMIEKECVSWASQGINIRYLSRETRRGFKAGALKEGLECDYAKECEHVAIFDADFQPEPDFLRQAVPFLSHNPDIALVQARWRFVNADECMLTRLQEMSYDYHFIAEQQVGSYVHAFFGFNGTGGIWRIAALNDAGGWNDRTTVEDMDLAVRAGLKGWKFVYVGTLEQYRWFCGPTNLFRQTVIDIAKNQKVSLWKKVYMIYNFFFIRKIVGHTCIFFSYCVVLPLTVLIAEVDSPKVGAVFIPCIIAAINAIFTTPRSLHLVVLWVLFECAMSLHRAKAIFTGLLGIKSANEWLVTQKFGDSITNNTHAELTYLKESRFKVLRDRILFPELGIAMLLFTSGCYDLLYRKEYYFIYMFLQAITFTVVGFGFIGKILPS